MDLKEYFLSITGVELIEAINARFEKYGFYQEFPEVKIIIPLYRSTGRWAAGNRGFFVVLDGIDEEDDAQADEKLNIVRHGVIDLFGVLVDLDFAVKDIYSKDCKGEVEEYQLSSAGVSMLVLGGGGESGKAGL